MSQKETGEKDPLYPPKGVELICGDSALQNGGHPHIKRHPQTRRLNDKSRREGCILHGPHGTQSEVTAMIPVAISVQLPSLGLSSAPWVFTKTTRPIMTILRTMGLRAIIYINNILIMTNSQSMARELPYFHHRLGSLLPGGQNWGAMVTDREHETHQLSGTISSHACSEVPCQRQRKHPDPLKIGQHNSPHLHQQNLEGLSPQN